MLSEEEKKRREQEFDSMFGNSNRISSNNIQEKEQEFDNIFGSKDNFLSQENGFISNQSEIRKQINNILNKPKQEVEQGTNIEDKKQETATTSVKGGNKISGLPTPMGISIRENIKNNQRTTTLADRKQQINSIKDNYDDIVKNNNGLKEIPKTAGMKARENIKEGNNDILPSDNNTNILNNEELNNNIFQDVPGLLQNTWRGAVNGTRQALNYYINANEVVVPQYEEQTTRQFLTSPKVSELEKWQYQSKNNTFIPEGVRDIIPNVETNKGKEKIQNDINQTNLEIQETANKMSNSVTRKLAGDIMPSIGQMSVGTILSYVNPALSIGYFISSAAGSYYDDGIQRGMSEDDALLYATIMGAMEGATEHIGLNQFKKAGQGMKALITGTGKEGLKNLAKEETINSLKEVFKNYGIGIADNFIQEAVIDPIQEATADIIDNKGEWDGILQKMLSDGIDGAIVAAIVGGADVGINSCVTIVDKVKNGNNITQDEYIQAINDIQQDGRISIEQQIQNSINSQVQNFNKNTYYEAVTDSDGNLSVIPVKGTAIENINQNINISPVIIKDNNTGYFNVIDGNSGLVLDTHPYFTEQEAEAGYNRLISNVDNATIKNINNRVTQNVMEIQNKIVEVNQELENYARNLNENAQIQLKNNQTTNDTTSQEKANIINFDNNSLIKNTQEQIKKDSENFAKQIEEVKNGTYSKRSMLTLLSHTPQPLLDIGLQDLPITMTQRHLDTIINQTGKDKNANYHNLGEDLVKQLPEAISNPLDIVKSNTKDDSIVLTTYLADKQDRNIIASIRINGKGLVNRILIDTNVMTSAYGRNNYDKFMQENLKNGNLLYDIDRGVIKKVDVARLQLPRSINFINNNIQQNPENVNIETKAKNNSNIVVEYKKFSKEFKEKGYIDLNGKKIDSIEDVADISQIFRNPKYETFRILYTKDNIIVGQESVSSRIPGETRVFNEKNKNIGFYKVKDRMKRLNADGYYIIHNHPSGKAKASETDINTTRDFMKNVSGFRGHIIVNSGTYAVIRNEDGALSNLITENELKIENYKPDEIDKIMNNSPWSNIKVNSNKQLALLMHNVKNNPNYSTMVLTDNQLYPRIVIDIPNKFLNMQREQIDGYIRNTAKKNGANRAFIATTNKNIYDKLSRLKTLTDGLLYEIKDGKLNEINALSKENTDRTKIHIFSLKSKNKESSNTLNSKIHYEKINKTDTNRENKIYNNIRQDKNINDAQNIKNVLNNSKNNTIQNHQEVKVEPYDERKTSNDRDYYRQQKQNSYLSQIVPEQGSTNAQQSNSNKLIEDSIREIEETGAWDNSIPVTKLTDIRKEIEKYLGFGIYKGHFREHAYGIYNQKTDIIRVKEYKDIDNILHETGHALDIGKRLNVDKNTIANELFEAVDKHGGYEDESREVRLEEGFAEIIRTYAIRPDLASSNYPNTTAVLEGIRSKDTSFNDFIGKIQEMTYNYIHQNPENRVLNNQSIGEQTDEAPRTAKGIKATIAKWIYDKDYNLKETVNEFAKASGKNLKDVAPSKNAYILTRLASGVQNKAISMISDGYIDLNGNKVMPGLNQLGEILNNDSQRFNDLRAYLVASRDLDYKSKNLKTGIRTNDSKFVINKFKNDTQIQKAAKVVYDTLDGVLKYATDNGLIAKETADSLRDSNAFYVPFQRVLENDRGNQVGRRGSVVDIIRKRTGSELDIKDVLENIVTNSANIIQQVENNNVLRALYKQGEEAGIKNKVFTEIPTPMKKVGTSNLSIWEKELQEQGVDTTNLDLEKTIDIFAPNNKIDRQNLITSFIDENGKRVYLQFAKGTEDLFYSVMNLDKNANSQFLKIMRAMNMPLRYGATMANVGFAIPNMISDTAQATIYSEAGFIPIVDNAIGVLDVLTATNKSVRNFMNTVSPEYANKINNLYAIYQQTGASSSTRMSQYRKSAQEIMGDVYGTSSKNLGINDKFRPLKNLLDLMTYIPELSESSTRFRVFERNYENYKNKGGTELDARIKAAIESRDATQDFGRTGTITREINQLIPFSAARIGSAYTFSEKISSNPKVVGAKIALLSVVAMAIKAIGYDDDEIEELNQRKKDDNFVLKIGDTVVTIKKPQGILRSIINLTEYIQDLATGHIEEGKEAERLGEWINNAIMDNMPADEITGLVPNPVAPLIENAINKDFYYNTDIVKDYDTDLPDYMQYYDYNSQLAILLGRVFNYSPAKIDNLISGYFGGLGTTVTNIIDWISGKLGVSVEEPDMGLEDSTIGKRFVVNVNEYSQSVDDIYTRQEELTKKQNGGTITEEETKELEKIKDAVNKMAALNKQIKEIKQDEKMSGDEKAEQIRPLQKQKTDVARQALGKDPIYTENTDDLEALSFYPSRSTLSLDGKTLELTEEMKKEYQDIAYEQYKKYESQGIYSTDFLESLKSKCKDLAKKKLMQKYKNQLK